MKRWITAAVILVFAGAAIMAGIMYHLDFDFTKLSKTVFVENSIDITDDFAEISADISTDLRFVPSENGSCTVRYTEQKGIDISAAVEDGVLVIKETDMRDWYDRIDFTLSSHETGITVFMPEKEYDSLIINSSWGDVTVPGDFSFREIGIHSDSGDISCKAPASGTVSINSDSGDICVSDVSSEKLNIATISGEIAVSGTNVAGNCNLKSDSGYFTVSKMECAGFASKTRSGCFTAESLVAKGKMNIKSTSGDVTLSRCDAGEIAISTDSGDVAGTLLSGKDFDAETVSGNISVPNTSEGGKCGISTVSGDVSMIVL